MMAVMILTSIRPPPSSAAKRPGEGECPDRSPSARFRYSGWARSRWTRLRGVGRGLDLIKVGQDRIQLGLIVGEVQQGLPERSLHVGRHVVARSEQNVLGLLQDLRGILTERVGVRRDVLA